MANWPASLPQYLSPQNFTESTQANTLRSKPDVGPYKSRPRTSKAPVLFNVQTPRLTSDQVDALMTFYAVDCAQGSLSFNWLHPRKQSAAVLNFAGEIKVQAASRNRFVATFDLLIK